MTGSHRASPPRSRAVPRAVIGLVSLAVVGVLAIVAIAVLHGKGSPKPAAGPLSSTTGTPTPTATPTPTPVAKATPSAKPTHARPRILPVPTSVPRQLTASNLVNTGFDDSIDPANGLFQTRSTAELSRWGARGSPGSPGTDTVYVAGRITLDPASGFARLPSIRKGALVKIRTDAGTITYRVQSVGSRPAAALLRDSTFTAKVAGRLILIGVRYGADSRQTGQTFVVICQLSGASRR